MRADSALGLPPPGVGSNARREQMPLDYIFVGQSAADGLQDADVGPDGFAVWPWLNLYARLSDGTIRKGPAIAYLDDLGLDGSAGWSDLEGHQQLIQDGKRWTILGWSKYQTIPHQRPTTRAGRAEYDGRAAHVPHDVPHTVPHDVLAGTQTLPSPPIPSHPGDPAPAHEGALPGEGDPDLLDEFHLLTLQRPWGRKSGDWLKDIQARYGLERSTAALQAEHSADRTVGTLIGRTDERLKRDEHKAAGKERQDEAAKIKAGHRTDPLIADITGAIENANPRRGKDQDRAGAGRGEQVHAGTDVPEDGPVTPF